MRRSNVLCTSQLCKDVQSGGVEGGGGQIIESFTESSIADHESEQHRQQLARLVFFASSLELGSGRFSRVTRCITVVLPTGKLSAFNVTEPCKNRP